MSLPAETPCSDDEPKSSEAGSGGDDGVGGVTGAVVDLSGDDDEVGSGSGAVVDLALGRMMAACCFTIGCRRQVRMSVRFTDEHGPVHDNICCVPCLHSNGGDHSAECEAVAAAAVRQRRRERRQELRERRRGGKTTDEGPARGGGGSGVTGGGVA